MKRFLVLMLLPGLALAEPGVVTRHFMDQPATVFDLGMFRLELWAFRSEDVMAAQFRDQTATTPKAVSFAATYDAERDFIRLSTTVMDARASDAEMEAGCRAVMRVMRINGSKTLWRVFAHYGEETEPAAQPMIEALYDRVELHCLVTGLSSAEPRFSASMPLHGAPGSFGNADDMLIEP